MTPGEGLCVIAEAGVNHDGSVADAHALVDLAASAGADAVKFQTFDPALLTSAGASTTPYQRRSGSVVSQAEMLASLVLPPSAWVELAAHSRDAGLEFLSTPFDLPSARMLADLGMGRVKTGSGELTNTPFLAAVAALGLPMIISTGMADEGDVAAAVVAVAGAPDVVLLHCVSAYPAPVAEANLLALPRLRQLFGLPVGWSDHTTDDITAIAAVALGAQVLEKHVTLDRTRRGPDHAASLEAEEFAEYVRRTRACATSLGDGTKRATPSERENAPLVRRSWHAARALPAGRAIAVDDVIALRPATGIPPTEDLLGRVVAVDVAAGDPVMPSDLA